MQFRQELVVHHPIGHIYDVVSDVNSYRYFLPSCVFSQLQVVNSEYIGRIDISYIGYNLYFITKNIHVKNQSINFNLIDGSFNILKGDWEFVEINKNTSLVKFNLDYELKNPIINRIVYLSLKYKTDVIELFQKRGDEIY